MDRSYDFDQNLGIKILNLFGGDIGRQLFSPTGFVIEFSNGNDSGFLNKP